MNECKTCQVIECVHQGCIKCACEMHDQCMSKHSWGKVCKHITNDQNMINMNNYGNSQKFLLIGVQKSEKNSIETFYQTLRVHTLHMYDKQCMNI